MPDLSPSRRSGRTHLARQGGPPVRVGLEALDGCLVAVHIVIQGREQFLRGEAVYELDDELGKLLRLAVEHRGEELELVITEARWNGQILPGQAVGCDYLIRLGCG